jgi:hypothetical protein
MTNALPTVCCQKCPLRATTPPRHAIAVSTLYTSTATYTTKVCCLFVTQLRPTFDTTYHTTSSFLARSTAAQPRSRTSASHVTACHIISQASSSHTRPSSTAYCHTLACPGRKRSKARTDTNHRSSSRSRETKGIPAGRWVERKVSGPRGRVGRYLCYAASSQKQAHERV